MRKTLARINFTSARRRRAISMSMLKVSNIAESDAHNLEKRADILGTQFFSSIALPTAHFNIFGL